MSDLPQLDPIFSHPFLYDPKSERSFNTALELDLMFDGGLRFVLFEIGDKGYLRLFKFKPGRKHRHKEIVDDFRTEAQADFSIKGGGYVRGFRAPERTRLEFYGSSTDYGVYDKNLLDALLKEGLDKRLTYTVN